MLKKATFKLLPTGLLLAAFLTSSVTTVCVGQSKKKDKKDGFVSIFDGKSLKGWDGDPTYWRAENGVLVGEITPTTLLKTNNFIIWKGGQPADFELKGEFNITESGNSGINYRSEQLTDIPHALRGYQADIDGKNNYTGQNYEERKRTTLAYRGQKTTIKPYDGPATPEGIRANVARNAWKGLNVTGSLGSSDSLKTLIKSNDWNSFHLIVKGNKLQHYINGVLMSEVTDEDTVNGAAKGFLGIQVHVGPPMKVQYRNLMIKQL
ncbi:3-keto-disaccharide hydrolase [Larkinella sp. VNQ87]|uniref:3-keto-disaccharide hydrolase n=1 Tax=Larkinella sp. VNQ87 TaxID=3400921 RepID=UPI003BFE3266